MTLLSYNNIGYQTRNMDYRKILIYTKTGIFGIFKNVKIRGYNYAKKL